jgi:hypothetical protein
MGRVGRGVLAVAGATSLAACSLIVDTKGLSGGGGGSGGNAAGFADGGDASSPGPGGPTAGGEAGVDSAYSAAVLADHPLAYWRLGESTTPRAVDRSPNGNDGVYEGDVTLGAPGALVGDPDTALSLGGDGFVRVGITSAFGFTGGAPYSIEVWINPILDGDYHTVLSRDDRPDNGLKPPTDGYTMTFNPGTPPQMYFTPLQGGGSSQVTTTAVQAGVWTHVVVTFDQVTLRLYLDGKVVSSYDSPVAVGTAKSPFVLGGDWGGNSSSYKGLVDEVALYSTALGANRIASHYAIGKGQAP